MIKRSVLADLNNMLDEQSIQILKILGRVTEMTDQKMAEKLKIRPNTVRRILNELHTKGILTYRKEREKSGWYNYIWRMNHDRVPAFIDEEKGRHHSGLQNRLRFEEDHHFFQCTDQCARLEYSRALEASFKCPFCGNALQHYDNAKDIRTLRREIKNVRFE